VRGWKSKIAKITLSPKSLSKFLSGDKSLLKHYSLNLPNLTLQHTKIQLVFPNDIFLCDKCCVRKLHANIQKARTNLSS